MLSQVTSCRGAVLLGWIALLVCTGRLRAEPELVRAFAFGSRIVDCATGNDPATSYTMVFHGSAAELEYQAGRGWGYEVTHPGDSGYFRFGPFDDSPNSRNVFPDSCPSELYDSFIGAKNFADPCQGLPAPSAGPCLPPEGIIFRADVPNGSYRFVAAVGSADNPHTHRLVAEDGGSGPPSTLGANHVVLVDNFDQAEAGTGVFARVGFDGLLPPAGAVNGFVDMDADGRATAAGASSPTLEVTNGYVRIHQLKGATSGGDPNGGDLVILELWRVDEGLTAIESGASWRYFPGLEEASSPDTSAWRSRAFNDSAWALGAAPFGYGDPPFGTDLSTLSPPMQGVYSALYLRRAFELSNAAAINQLVADVDYDDAFAMWINGFEVLRLNVPGADGSPVPFNTFASSEHESGAIEGYFLPDPAGYLVDGTNVVAVQVLNVSITSSDLNFDLELYDPTAPDVSPPAVASVVPAPGLTVRSLSQVQVTFSEEVTGVDASDLRIAGVPASSVSGVGRGPYTFSFPSPPAGPVAVTWAPGSGIVDFAEPPNAFTGSPWSYTLDPSAPVGNLEIQEVLAVNRSGLRDEDGEENDWFEVVNVGSESVNLLGYAVTDDEDDPGKWTFPNVTLPAGSRLVVFASGKDRRPTSGNLHTSFSVASGGEYLAIFDAESPRGVVFEFSPRLPRQRADISYGLNTLGEAVYFSTPTPGAANTGGQQFDGFVLEPTCTPGRGIYDAPFLVSMSTPTPGAAIRYTLDGSEPTASAGTLFTAPFQIDGTPRRGVVTLRAVAYLDGFLSSDVVTNSYVFPADVVTQPNDPDGFPSNWTGQAADYEMDPDVASDPGHRDLVREGLRAIPTLSLVGHVDDLFSSNRGILANPSQEGVAWERPVSAELIYPDLRDGFQVNCGLRVQGGSSTSGWKVLKVSMRLLFKGDYGPTKLSFPLFPGNPVTEFDTIVLDAHLNQTWNHPNHGQRVRAQYCRDQFVSLLQNELGGFAPHDVFAHLYVNGLYWGVYDLHERPDASFAAETFGGDKEEYDAIRHTSSNVVDGSSTAYNAMLSAARSDLAVQANYLALQQHVDVGQLIDYMLANIWSGNDDWAHHNWYATRLRAPGAPWLFHSWDAEHVLKDVNINRTSVNNSGSPAEVYSRLRANAEFRLLFADHVQRHFSAGGPLYVNPARSAWDPTRPEDNAPAALWMRLIEEIDSYQQRIDEGGVVGSAVSCEAARWGDLRRPSDPYTRNDEWLSELQALLSGYFPNRSRNVLNQLRSADLYPDVDAPVFSHRGGRIVPPISLSMTLAAGTTGTIYYTTDGTDPRVPVSGSVSGSASTYAAPIEVDGYARFRARVRSGTTWSALTDAEFSVVDPAEALHVSEIMYNPLGGTAYEFIEIRNASSYDVRVLDLAFVEGISGIITQETLAPGAHLVLVSDLAAFESRYPGVAVGGFFSGQLSSDGERLTLATLEGDVISSFTYDDEGLWPLGPDGFGFSLVRADASGLPGLPGSWRASRNVHGSPGSSDPAPAPAGVVINEVLANSSPPFEGAIELFNRSASTVDASGWYLSNARDDETALRKFRIPVGTSLPPGGFAVFYEDEFGASFALDAAGGGVYLTAVNGAGSLTGHINGAEYSAAPDGVSIGRVPTSTGETFAALSETSFGVTTPATVAEFRTGSGDPNAPALFGPVIINEIHYNPASGQEAFLELHNPSGSAVALFDAGSGRGWRIEGLRDGFEVDTFEFGAGASIPAGGYLLVVGIQPATFRSLHAVPAAVPIHGPYGGGLDDGGERLRLERPDDTVGPTTAYVSVDEVRYDDEAPWPLSPDGDGWSLERIVATAFGDDAANWDASTRLAGTPGTANTASTPGENRFPEAVFTVSSANGEAPLDVLFDASGSFDLDGAIVRYDWDFDDGLTASAMITQHTFVTPGLYNVVLTVEDDEGAVDTVSRLISVEIDPGGFQLPADANQDAVLDISDALAFLNTFFGSGGREPPCDGAIQQGGNRTLLDSNGDLSTDLSDAVYFLNYLFLGGPAPTRGTSCQPIPGCPDVCAS